MITDASKWWKMQRSHNHLCKCSLCTAMIIWCIKMAKNSKWQRGRASIMTFLRCQANQKACLKICEGWARGGWNKGQGKKFVHLEAVKKKKVQTQLEF